MTIVTFGNPADLAYDGTYVKFRLSRGEQPLKTHHWNVSGENGNVGDVMWFGRWRKYVFAPSENCVFEEICLTEIAEFIKSMTAEHKGTKK